MIHSLLMTQEAMSERKGVSNVRSTLFYIAMRNICARERLRLSSGGSCVGPGQAGWWSTAEVLGRDLAFLSDFFEIF